jgi:hypothetical protein
MKLKKFLAVFTTVTMFLIPAVGANAAPGGDRPTKYYWENEIGGPQVYEGPFMPCDGFDLFIHIEYSGWWMVHPETPGKNHWETYFSFGGMRVFNPNDPGLFLDGVPGGKVNRKWTGTAFESDLIETGVQVMLTVPHYGVIFRDVGRVVIDIDTWQPIFYTGQWDDFDGIDEDLFALCEILAE